MRRIKAFLPEEAFYDDLVTMLMSLSSVMYVFHVSYTSNNPVELKDRPLSEWMEYIKPIKWPEQPFALPSRLHGNHLILYPFWVFAYLSLRGWPDHVEYKTGEAPSESMKFRVDTDRRRELVSRIIGSSFVSYYESERTRIIERYGSEASDWPDVLNYARHVRNGFAHGGSFDIRKPNAPSVAWGIWTLGPKENCDPVLFGDGAMLPADIIWLMKDIDVCLSQP
jgi:hypothetical protein